MFGGYGIFENKAMFALINSEGDVYFKVDPSNQKRFEEVQAKKYGKMPYFQIPPDILKDERRLCEWAKNSIALAHEAKKKK